MHELKKLLLRYPKDTVVTVMLLWELIEQVEREQRNAKRKEYEYDKYLSELEAECTNPNQ